MNNEFENYPIELKEINPEDFPQFLVGEKSIIQPNSQGYINDAIQSKIDLEEKNTVVINAAVGQGKTYSIIEIVKKYYELDRDYLIFIASPFVSLVEQYYNDVIEKGIPEDKVFRYETLNQNELPDFTRQRVHIVTANCLLGNPGEEAFINSSNKRYYLKTLSNYCVKYGKKVVFVYDEIHDSIKNFKEEYVFNLWKWKNVVHKNFIISATYNEASKTVIEYLAELTEDKIQIIESERKRFPEKQSKLFLHYNSAHKFKNDNTEIANLIKEFIDKGKEIDILSSSKKLAKSIIENREVGIGKELYKKYDNLNNCTSDVKSNQEGGNSRPQNRFNPTMCNVGTNFKTGISIKKENHVLVIIIPDRSSRTPFKNYSGIFSDGINSVIQALARQRKPEEIHIILPRPDAFEYDSLPFESQDQKQAFKLFYEDIKYYKEPDEKVSYLPLSIQREKIQDEYNKLKENIDSEIQLVNTTERTDKVRLSFPEFKLYSLEKGEELLANKHLFYGKDLSAYISYSAFTNQFINCRLEKVNEKSVLVFEEGRVIENLNQYYERSFEDKFNERFTDWVAFKRVYKEFREFLFGEFELKYKKDGTMSSINPYKNKYFETQLLQFLALKFYGTAYNFNEQITIENIKDIPYTRAQYFTDLISHSETIENIDNYIEEEREQVEALKNLNYFREKLIRNQQELSYKYKGEQVSYTYLPSKPFNNFIEESEKPKLLQLKNYFIEKDVFISNGVFEFKRRFERTPDDVALYNILLDDFFIVSSIERKPKINGVKTTVKEIEYYIDITRERGNDRIDLISNLENSASFFSNNLLDNNIEW